MAKKQETHRRFDGHGAVNPNLSGTICGNIGPTSDKPTCTYCASKWIVKSEYAGKSGDYMYYNDHWNDGKVTSRASWVCP